MQYFLNFLNSDSHFYYVIFSYLIVFFILMLIFIISLKKLKKLEKIFNKIVKDEGKK